jgi:hypothetical protein
MVVGDLTHEDGVTWYRYRGKGNKQGKRELPEPAYVAITAALSAFGRDVAAMAPDAPLWPSSVGDSGVTSGDVLRQPAALSEGGRPAACRRPHLPALGGEAPARCR